MERNPYLFAGKVASVGEPWIELHEGHPIGRIELSAEAPVESSEFITILAQINDIQQKLEYAAGRHEYMADGMSRHSLAIDEVKQNTLEIGRMLEKLSFEIAAVATQVSIAQEQIEDVKAQCNDIKALLKPWWWKLWHTLVGK